MKKLLALILVLVMALSMFSACSTDSSSDDEDKKSEIKNEEDGDKNEDDKKDPDDPDDPPAKTEEIEKVSSIQHDDLRYVMIYNPNIYDETASSDKSILSTGDFGSQIEVDTNRGDSLEESAAPVVTPFSQDDINSLFPITDIPVEENRAEKNGRVFKEGDEFEFYHFNSYNLNSNRVLDEFTCEYTGEYCNVWTMGGVDDDLIEEYGEYFDENAYEETVDTFGTPRFVGKGAKVNILFYPLPSSIGGVFCAYDLFATGEVTKKEITNYGLNTDSAIIHVNLDLADDPKAEDFMHGCLAHELQHLICASEGFENNPPLLMGTWLNEAMSGYIEEKTTPGSKKSGGHYSEYLDSDAIRAGQSMYNFATTYNDIGVYGSVYYFSEYLAELAGEDVFKDIHTYWRESYSDTLCDSEAIAKSVSKSVYKKIDSSIIYNDNINHNSEEDEWMSKLILNFYLETLSNNEIKGFKNIKPAKLLYDEINSTDIEGGGRIIVEVKKDKFKIPSDADDGLIYVGLNEDFEIITDFVTGK